MSQHQHPNGQQFLNKIENTREHMYTKIHPHGLKLCENSFNGGSSKQASYTCWWLATPTSPSPTAPWLLLLLLLLLLPLLLFMRAKQQLPFVPHAAGGGMQPTEEHLKNARSEGLDCNMLPNSGRLSQLS